MTITHTDTLFRIPTIAHPVDLGAGVVGVWPSHLSLVRMVRLGGVEVLDYGTLAALRRGDGVVDVWATGPVFGALLLMGMDVGGTLAFFSDADADQIRVYDLSAGAWLVDGAEDLPRFVLGEDGARVWVTDLEQGWQHHLIEAEDADITEPVVPSRRTA